MDQLEVWKGEFGQAYTDRNAIDWHVRVPAFQEMLRGLSLERALEVGCNRGHNLLAVSHVTGPDTEVIGIEPNPYALKIARSSDPAITAIRGSVYDLPFKDGYFDLAFTAGVLIHIPLANLPAAMKEIGRVTRKYILCIEYFAEEETEIRYREQANLLWKRDFLKHYTDSIPGLKKLRSGFWDAKDGFDRANWWLLERERV